MNSFDIPEKLSEAVIWRDRQYNDQGKGTPIGMALKNTPTKNNKLCW